MVQHTIYQVNDIFSLKQTFECGQCFRWDACGTETYHGVAFGREVWMSLKGSQLTVSCSKGEFEMLWRSYLDLDRDYAAIRQAVSIDEKTAQAVAYGAGIRILRQDPWETLCSFIISQCNHIPRIRRIISSLCAFCGEEIADRIYAFPTPEHIASFSAEELRAAIRCGYRAPYIIAAARAVAEGKLDLAALHTLPTVEAKQRLLALPGVGEKVASCMLLFGLGKLDAFPIDVWMRRTILTVYGKGFDPAAAFGAYAGIAQQYLFYQARSEHLYQ